MSLESTDGFPSEQIIKTRNHEALFLLRQYILIFTSRFIRIESINPKQTQKQIAYSEPIMVLQKNEIQLTPI